MIERFIDSLPPWMRHGAMLAIVAFALGGTYAGITWRIAAVETAQANEKEARVLNNKEMTKVLRDLSAKVGDVQRKSATSDQKLDDIKEQGIATTSLLNALLLQSNPPRKK